jgi:hypothetical protein
MTLRPLAAASVVALCALLATGCSPADPAVTAPRSATASAAPTPVESPSASPVAATCESVLDDESVTAYTEAGWTPSSDFAQRMIDQQNRLRVFAESGGLLCQWGGGGDWSEYYGVTSLPADRMATERERLLAEGYSSEAFDGGELLVGPPMEGIYEHNLIVGDSWIVAFSTTRIAEIQRNRPVGS